MALLRKSATLARVASVRGISTSAPLVSCYSKAVKNVSYGGADASTLALAGSPLFLTSYDKPGGLANPWEAQFIPTEMLNNLIEGWMEAEAGPWFLNAAVFLTALRMLMYYGVFQPSYLYGFQQRYGQTWTVGHHLYGSNLPNPLKKGK
mmetsp:Transcript_79104/g.181013  ORF Transcript_79104/g.181013 Transcript_79104/m.181013 type:complete len:149 (-) Transcript_79104:88-534(-)